MNPIVHFELPADNLDRAQAFYKDVFGWQVNAVPEFNYALVQTTEVGDDQLPKKPGAINGGMLKREEPITAPVITINVPSIDEAAKHIEAHGGILIRAKMPVGDMGFAAYFKDPEGNVVGLWEDVKTAS